MSSMRCLLLLCVTLGAAACGTGERDEPKLPTGSAANARMNLPEYGGESQTPPKPVTSLKRAAVRETIQQGLGVFLQNVTLDDWPVMREGKFHGFKIKAINPQWGIDLRPGDVVTRVNGVVPEHPEEADATLRSLEKAASVKVDFEREGKPRTLELPIVD
jgi:type II secretory pathway component PulC